MSPATLTAEANRIHLFVSFRLQRGREAAFCDALEAFGKAALREHLGAPPEAEHAHRAGSWAWDSLSVPRAADEHAPTTAEAQTHPDLFPVVRRILVGATGDMQVPPHFPPPYRLHAGLLASHYRVVLNKRAQARLAAEAPAHAAFGAIPLHLHDVRLYLFGTGVGALGFELEVVDPFTRGGDAVPAQLVVEAAAALCADPQRASPWHAAKFSHFKALEAVACGATLRLVPEERYGVRRFQPDAGGEEYGSAMADAQAGESVPVCVDLKQQLTPLALAQTLLRVDALPAGTIELDAGRLFSYAAVLLSADAPRDAMDALAYRLAHKFTADYAIGAAQVETAGVWPFDNICHSMATQGGAVVARNTGVAFVEGYLTQSVPRTYLPLCLLARHEYLVLRRLSHADVFAEKERSPRERERWIAHVQGELMDFRLRYRFSWVSDMSNHNLVFAHWRRVLGLDDTLAELSQDVAEGEQEVRATLERLAKRERLLFHGLAALGVLFLLRSAFEFVADVFLLSRAKSMLLLREALPLLAGPDEAARTAAAAAMGERLTRAAEHMAMVERVEQIVFWVGIAVAAYAIGFVLRHRQSAMGGE